MHYALGTAVLELIVSPTLGVSVVYVVHVSWGRVAAG